MATHLSIVPRTRKLVQLLPGHHQDAHWPPYQAILEAFLRDGWNVATHESPRTEAPLRGRKWHHPNIPDTTLATMRAWYVPGVHEEYARASEVLATVKREGYDRYVIIGHSLHAHLAYALAHEHLKAYDATVVALVPFVELGRARDKKLAHIGIDCVDDPRFIEGAAAPHRDKYSREHAAMIYTKQRFWNDYEERVAKGTPAKNIASWRGRSLIIEGERDNTLGPNDITLALDATRGRGTLVQYPGAHRPSVEEARALGNTLVERLQK